jgi:hypothetical protein
VLTYIAPQLSAYFGDLKTYGEDFGSSREGRRYFVPEYSYKDEYTDVEYHRVKFNLEGERGRKAAVWAEVRQGTYDFRYLIVLLKDKSRVWSVIDNRRPDLTVEERQARLTTLIQDAGWQFYADGETDVYEQSRELGDYWLKVKCIRCDQDPTRCDEAGITAKPAWKTHSGAVIKGAKSLKELEGMSKDLAKQKNA